MHSLRCIGNWHLWIKHVRESAATNPKHSLESLVFPRERICALPYITHARIAASLTHHATRGRVSSCATDERQPFAREPQMADNGTFHSTQDLLFPTGSHSIAPHSLKPTLSNYTRASLLKKQCSGGCKPSLAHRTAMPSDALCTMPSAYCGLSKWRS